MIGPHEKFWQWFDAHQDQLLNFELDRERIFDELSGQLNCVHPELTFEFGPKEYRREFVISAGGIKVAFPAVTSLVAAAPKLDRWHITAFRPRRTPINRVQIRDKCFDPDDVEFSLLTNGSLVGLQLFISGFKEDDRTLKQIGYLMLDDALGECDVETKVGLIQMLPSESPITTRRYAYWELPTRFDQLVSQLAGPTLPH